MMCMDACVDGWMCWMDACVDGWMNDVYGCMCGWVYVLDGCLCRLCECTGAWVDHWMDAVLVRRCMGGRMVRWVDKLEAYTSTCLADVWRMHRLMGKGVVRCMYASVQVVEKMTT